MSVTKYTLALIFTILSGVSALAQQAGQPTGMPELPASRADAQIGQPYQLGTYGDWSVRCLRAPDDQNDPCEMHQLMLGPDGSPTAEINLFQVNRENVVAGATIVTPLETLLTQNLRLKIDGGTGKVYPFTLCSRQGCVAQVGFLDEELNAMKAGTEAQVIIVPAAAPESTVELKISLSGFTAAYEALQVAQLGD